MKILKINLSILFVLFIMFSGAVFNVFASDVTLEWDANPDADYYEVYWGLESGKYTEKSESIPAPATTYKIIGIDNREWFTAVKAFNSYGNSSDFSEELSFEINAVPVEKPINYRVTTIDLSVVKESN